MILIFNQLELIKVKRIYPMSLFFDDPFIGKKIGQYTILEVLGFGAWAKVYKAFDNSTSANVAVKIINKDKLNGLQYYVQMIQNEIRIMQMCDNPNVIKLIKSFESKNNIFIVMEYCNGGDLEQKIANGILRQDQAVIMLTQFLNGFKGLHELGAMHRDFKASNILFLDNIAKIADLGFAKILNESLTTKTKLGTKNTMAPEVLKKKQYSFEADIWSLGVVYYQMLFGKYPFSGFQQRDLFRNIEEGIRFDEKINVSSSSKDFIRRCLTVDPEKRIGWRQIYEHPLLKGTVIRRISLSNINSKVLLQRNVDFYISRLENIKKTQSNNMNVQHEETLERDMQIQATKRKSEDLELLKLQYQKYSELYIQKRNQLMMIIKYCIEPLCELEGILINPNMYAFLVCKKILFQLHDFRDNLHKNVDVFGVVKHKEYFESEQYENFKCLVKQDCERVQISAFQFGTQVKTNRKNVLAELDLYINTGNLDKIFVQCLKEYIDLLKNPKYTAKADKRRTDRLIKAFEYILTHQHFNSTALQDYVLN